MNLRYAIAAREELNQAAGYLEGQRRGYGTRFLKEVDAAVKLILERPQAWAPLGAGCRRCDVRGFSYALVYRVRNEQIEILAVAHDRQRPGYWRDRLQPH